MLVIISDLHLTDGSSGETIKEKAFKIFRTRLSDMAYDASFRERLVDGNMQEYYEPIKEMTILLLGDIFDVIRSDKWLDAAGVQPVKPWHNPYNQAYFEKVKTITKEIITENAKSLQVIKSIATKGIFIPASVEIGVLEDGRNKVSVEKVIVQASIFYMVGNHDWFFVLENNLAKAPTVNYNEIRQLAIDSMGLSNLATIPFPHLIKEGDANTKNILDIFKAHHVYAVHGDIFDPTNCTFDENKNPIRNKSSMGDMIVVELLNKIPVRLEKRFGNQLPLGLIKKIKEIDNVRPYSLIPNWIDHVLREYDNGLFSTQQNLYNEVIGEIVDLLESFCASKDLEQFDDTQIAIIKEMLGNFLSWLPNSYKLFSFASTLLNKFSNHKSQRIESYRDEMLKYTEHFDPQFNYFVMGHTHYQEMTPLRANQLYFNTGTWRQIHDLPYERNANNDFWDYKIMTYVSFYLKDERKQHNFEFWNGSLDE